MPLKKRSSVKKINRRAVKTITSNVKGRINDLAELLYSFIPLRTRNNKTETFYTIFKESSIQSYFPKGAYKKVALEKALEKLFRYHKKLPYTIFRKVVAAAIKYRRYKRNPLKRSELDQLDSFLLKLGINLTTELQHTELDEFVPLITVPPAELIRRLESHPLCEQLNSEPLELFRNGHFNESVRKASERFEVAVQDLTGLNDIGKNLMGKAFNLNGPIITLNQLSNENERGIQEGFQFLSMGMIRAMRNIFSHGDEDQRSPEEAYEMLMFINWLFRQLP